MNERFPYRFDMVHHNPGETLTDSEFNDPLYLARKGYNGMVINDFVSVHAAISYDSFDKRIFPQGADERDWVDAASLKIQDKIKQCHQAGIQCLYFTDMIVLPARMKDLYHKELCNSEGLIDMEKPLTQAVHRMMIREIFGKYPGLDGLVIRTGETYLHNVPYHTGNGPVQRNDAFYDILINLLREEVCERYNKLLIYRTWGFDGFHESPEMYKRITNRIEPHRNLLFSIKHTQLDYWRTMPFNPTLAIGRHKQIVEVQCQREYEGKGAYPNYIANGVIEGFEELNDSESPKCLRDLLANNLVQGIWTWSRGGGWVGPYIRNEFWCKLNAGVIVRWACAPEKSEAEIFTEYTGESGIDSENSEILREICLLSAKAILLGHYYKEIPFPEAEPPLPSFHFINWTRDEFLGGLDILSPVFEQFIKKGKLKKALDEKKRAAEIWRAIVELSEKIDCVSPEINEYVRVSSWYGNYLFHIIYHGWRAMAYGLAGDQTGNYRWDIMEMSINEMDKFMEAYIQLEKYAQCATLYKPFSWRYTPPVFHGKDGLAQSLLKYRSMIENYKNQV